MVLLGAMAGALVLGFLGGREWTALELQTEIHSLTHANRALVESNQQLRRYLIQRSLDQSGVQAPPDPPLVPRFGGP